MHHAAVRSSKRQPKDIGIFYDSPLTFLPKDFNWQIWRNCVDGEINSILPLTHKVERRAATITTELKPSPGDPFDAGWAAE
jgi:hypothetical protein